MKKFLSIVLSALMLSCAMAGCAGVSSPGQEASLTPEPTPQGPAVTGPALPEKDGGDSLFENTGFVRRAENYDEIFRVLSENSAPEGYGYGGAFRVMAEDFLAPMDVSLFSSVDSPSASAGAEAGENHSSTNIQVEGYDEADRIKTDGKYIYILDGEELTVLRAAGKNTRPLARLELFDDEEKFSGDDRTYYAWQYCRDMYLAEDLLVVIRSGCRSEGTRLADGKWNNSDEVFTEADFYDVSDPSRPAFIKTLGQDGELLSSRLAGGTLYLVSQTYIYNSVSRDDPHSFLPRTWAQGEKSLFDCGEILLCPSGTNSCYTVLGAVDLETLAHTGRQALYGGHLSAVYMNDSGLYLAVQNRRTEKTRLPEKADGVFDVVNVDSESVTALLRFAPGGELSPAAAVEFEGSLMGQFAIDEYMGALRVVAEKDAWHATYYYDDYGELVLCSDQAMADDSSTRLLTFDVNAGLAPLGAIEDLAPGERVYSVRFDGEVGYFVTFRNVDPLFAADLSDPTDPKIMSRLKIPGFSTYLHLWDENLLLGIGQSADENGFTRGMKLSMFDVSDKFAVAEEAVLELGEDTWSGALSDHHQVFIDTELGIFGFGINGRQCQYVIFSYENGAFVQRAAFDCGGCPDPRGMYSGEYFYLILDDSVRVFALEDLSFLAEIEYD